jgi:hypothetical protein
MRPSSLFAILLLPLTLCAVGCGGAGVQPWTPPSGRDGHEDPARLRPGYGNSETHTWWPLTAPEAAALQGADKARQGDANALLALAILASGDRRDSEAYAGYQRRVDQFIAEVRSTVQGATDDWHRGYELNRAVHRAFFTGERTELGAYQLTQGRLTGIFDTGHYNCISSAILYTILAREFDMPVRGVLVPTHAFVELGPPGGKTLEVETTSDTGFDLVHDARFFAESAARWSSQRGLRPVTLDEYQHRRIVEPLGLVAQSMREQAGNAGEQRGRLAEAWATVDPDDAEAQLVRVHAYHDEARELWMAKASRTIVRMFDAVGPTLTAVTARWKANRDLMGVAAWTIWYYADALLVLGRGDDGVTIANDVLARFDDGWIEAASLRSNLVQVLDDRMLELMASKQYDAATKVMTRAMPACHTVDVCVSNVEVVWGNWAIDYQNAGDWQGARKALQGCLDQLPGDARCSDALRDLESRHRF